jgi:hypothetical protein
MKLRNPIKRIPEGKFWKPLSKAEAEAMMGKDCCKASPSG